MIIKVIILKDVIRESGKVWKPGRNAEVEDWYGYQLIGKKKAGQIPWLNPHGVWTMDGQATTKYPELRKTEAQGLVTVEEYNKFKKPEKVVKKINKKGNG